MAHCGSVDHWTYKPRKSKTAEAAGSAESAGSPSPVQTAVTETSKPTESVAKQAVSSGASPVSEERSNATTEVSGDSGESRLFSGLCIK